MAMWDEIPLLLQRGGAAIVNTSSGAGVKGFVGGAAHGASVGVIGATKTRRPRLPPAPVSASTPSAPGIIERGILRPWTRPDRPRRLTA